MEAPPPPDVPVDSLEKRLARVVAELTPLRDPQRRLSRLVNKARAKVSMPEPLRRDVHLVRGCQVRLWLVPELREGRCHFQTDSDAVTLKALCGLLCELADGLAPEVLLGFDARFLEAQGLLRQLAESRRATVLRFGEMIREFAASQLETERMPDAGCRMPDSSTKHQAPRTTRHVLPLFDAHNHLQDQRLAGNIGPILAECRRVGVERMVVNGTCARDWPGVAALARQFPDLVIPSFGWHPWHQAGRGSDWRDGLVRAIDETPGAVVGEIGLDRWILEQSPEILRRHEAGDAVSLEEQEEVFVWQLRLAAERNLPASVHCLKAFGRMLELLRAEPRPARGFLLHSYGGPTEMVPAFAELGAYFSFPGYFLPERKARQREMFKTVPPDRLLVETDAPDQSLPEPPFVLADADGRPLNHPANLLATYQGLSAILSMSPEHLASRTAENFQRLFGER